MEMGACHGPPEPVNGYCDNQCALNFLDRDGNPCGKAAEASKKDSEYLKTIADLQE